MIYKNYFLSVYETSGYSENSTDNKNYDRIIRLEESDFNKQIIIEVTRGDNKKEILLIVSAHTPVSTCAALHPEGLFLMLNSTLCVFSPESLEITNMCEIDPMGTMFEARSYKDDYILYGEMEIYRVNKDLEVLWNFSARDIFVRYQGDEPAFEMKDDKICLIDFMDYCYEIDYDGNLLSEKKI